MLAMGPELELQVLVLLVKEEGLHHLVVPQLKVRLPGLPARVRNLRRF